MVKHPQPITIVLIIHLKVVALVTLKAYCAFGFTSLNFKIPMELTYGQNMDHKVEKGTQNFGYH